VLSLRVLFCPDLSAEPANQLDVIHGDVTLSCLQLTTFRAQI
jgi:hypothetical protein